MKYTIIACAVMLSSTAFSMNDVHGGNRFFEKPDIMTELVLQALGHKPPLPKLPSEKKPVDGGSQPQVMSIASLLNPELKD